MEELDRVLDRDDVLGALSLIESIIVASVVDLPEPVGPVTRTRPRGCRELEEHLGQAEVLERLDHLRHEAEGCGEAVALEVDVDAEAGDAGDGVGEVDLAVDLEPLLLLGREDAIEKVARLVRREGLEVLRAAPACRGCGVAAPTPR